MFPLLSSKSKSQMFVQIPSKKKNTFYTLTDEQERFQVKQFWNSLSLKERKSLIQLEKGAILKKLQSSQPKCSCSVCGRKRSTIEQQLEDLFDQYYTELTDYEFLHQGIHPHTSKLPPLVDESDDDIDGMYDDISSDEDIDLQFKTTNGVLTVAQDLLQTDGQHFLQMLELHDSNWLDYDSDDEVDKMIQGRKMFTMFCARMLEQRVVLAYREKAAAERAQQLFKELEQEDEQKRLKKEQKMKKVEREKEKQRMLKERAEKERIENEQKRLKEEEEVVRKRQQELIRQAQEKERARLQELAQREKEERIKQQALEKKLKKQEEERKRLEEEARLQREREEQKREKELRKKEQKEKRREKKREEARKLAEEEQKRFEEERERLEKEEQKRLEQERLAQEQENKKEREKKERQRQRSEVTLNRQPSFEPTEQYQSRSSPLFQKPAPMQEDMTTSVRMFFQSTAASFSDHSPRMNRSPPQETSKLGVPLQPLDAKTEIKNLFSDSQTWKLVSDDFESLKISTDDQWNVPPGLKSAPPRLKSSFERDIPGFVGNRDTGTSRVYSPKYSPLAYQANTNRDYSPVFANQPGFNSSNQPYTNQSFSNNPPGLTTNQSAFVNQGFGSAAGFNGQAFPNQPSPSVNSNPSVFTSPNQSFNPQFTGNQSPGYLSPGFNGKGYNSNNQSGYPTANPTGVSPNQPGFNTTQSFAQASQPVFSPTPAAFPSAAFGSSNPGYPNNFQPGFQSNVFPNQQPFPRGYNFATNGNIPFVQRDRRMASGPPGMTDFI